MTRLLSKLHWHLSCSTRYPGVHSVLKGLRRERHMDAPQWHELRLRRLRKLLQFAADRVPYYRQLFQEAGLDPATARLPEDMARLPVLRKQTIAEHRDRLLADNGPSKHRVENATGGSTGVPLRFYQDRWYRTVALASDAYVRQWWRVLPYDRTVAIWGEDHDPGELSWRERFGQWRGRFRCVNAFHLNDAKLHEFCRMLRQWKPAYLMGYATAADTLARFAIENGYDDLRFRAIRSAAEMLLPEARERIERAFASPVYNFYGSREVNNLAAECAEGRQLHLVSTWRYVEIVDEDGTPLPPGESGYVAVTDLSNFTMPFVRYRNEDLATIGADPCSCGRPSPCIEKLLGRSSDMIRTPDGNSIHGEYFTHLFYGREDIRRFQVHQVALDRIVVRYVPTAPSAEDYMQTVKQKILTRVGAGVEVEICACDDIAASPSGKYRFTISDVPADNGT